MVRTPRSRIGTRQAFVIILLVEMLFTACGSSTAAESLRFDEEPFVGFAGRTLLGIDLRDDLRRPTAGLMIRIAQGDSTGRRNIIVPFRTHGVRSSRRLLSTASTYDDFTLISLSIGAESLRAGGIPLLPAFGRLESDPPRLSDLPPGIYYHEIGLQRWFVLVDSSSASIRRLGSEFPGTTLETIEAIAIAIPPTAEGRDVRPGASVHPEPSARVGNVMLFSGVSTQQRANRIEVRYEVKPSAAQIAASSSISKLVLVVVIPVLTLLFLPAKEVGKPRARRWIIGAGIAIQTTIVIVVLGTAFYLRRMPPTEAVVELIATLLGVFGELGVLWVKSRD